MKQLLILLALLGGFAQAQTTTTITGKIKDLSQSVVTSGKVVFTLQIDTTISGVARLTNSQITCTINGSGHLVALGGGSCVLTMNTAILPAGTSYQACLWPYGVKSSCFNMYAVNPTLDLTTAIPTPATSPTYSFLDNFSTQTSTGKKGFTLLNGIRFSDAFFAASANLRADAAATNIGTSNPGTIVTSPTETAGIPTTTQTNLSWLDLRLGTAATPQGNRKFAYPSFFLRSYDNSPYSTDANALGDRGFLPLARFEVTGTGSGDPIAFYASTILNSTTANNVQDATNAAGALISVNSSPTDTHSGIWGLNVLAAQNGGGILDQSIFGFEVNLFNNRVDSGFIPLVTRPKFGIASTSNGTFPPTSAFIATNFPGFANRWHVGLFINDAIDAGVLIGGGNTTHMAYGIRLGETNTGSGANNYGSNLLGFTNNVWTGATAAQHYFDIQSAAGTGANPPERLSFGFNSGARVEAASLDNAGKFSFGNTLQFGGAGRSTIRTKADNTTTQVGGVQFLTTDNGVHFNVIPTDQNSAYLGGGQGTFTFGGRRNFNSIPVDLVATQNLIFLGSAGGASSNSFTLTGAPTGRRVWSFQDTTDTVVGRATSDALTSKGFARLNVALVNGANLDVAIATNNFVKITGPTGVFSVSGFVNGADGRLLELYNSVAFAMTIKNEDAAETTAANRITTLTGADVTLRAGTSFASFIYDLQASRWILKSTN